MYVCIISQKVALFYSPCLSDPGFTSSKIINLDIATGTSDELIPVAVVLAETCWEDQ
jgi:hypothetical protein